MVQWLASHRLTFAFTDLELAIMSLRVTHIYDRQCLFTDFTRQGVERRENQENFFVPAARYSRHHMQEKQ